MTLNLFPNYYQSVRSAQYEAPASSLSFHATLRLHLQSLWLAAFLINLFKLHSPKQTLGFAFDLMSGLENSRVKVVKYSYFSLTSWQLLFYAWQWVVKSWAWLCGSKRVTRAAKHLCSVSRVITKTIARPVLLLGWWAFSSQHSVTQDQQGNCFCL